MPRSSDQMLHQAHARIVAIRDALGHIDYVCSGTLIERMKVCGKPNCRCAQDPAARHGPYFVWGRLKNRKLVQQTLTAEQAVTLRLAIDNYRKIRKLLRAWERETERVLKVRTDQPEA